MKADIRKIVAICVLVFFVVSVFFFYRHYTKQKEASESDSITSLHKGSSSNKDTKQGGSASANSSNDDNDAIVINNPEFNTLAEKAPPDTDSANPSNAVPDNSVESAEIKVGLLDGQTTPSTIVSNLDTYKSKGMISLKNAQVIAFYDKHLYGKTLALLKVEGADNLISTGKYDNNEVYVMFACTDKIELSKQLSYGNTISVLGETRSATTEQIKTSHGVFGDMLVIFGTYTKK